MEKKPIIADPLDKPKVDPQLAVLKDNFKQAAERQVAVMRDQVELKHLTGKELSCYVWAHKFALLILTRQARPSILTILLCVDLVQFILWRFASAFFEFSL